MRKKTIATYAHDERGRHKFVIDDGQGGIKGTILIPKNKRIPKELILTLKINPLVPEPADPIKYDGQGLYDGSGSRY